MSRSTHVSTLRKQLVWSHLRTVLPAVLALSIAATSIIWLTSLLDRMQRENIPSVEAANLMQLGLQRSSASLQGWVALKQPELKDAVSGAWRDEISPALAALMVNEGEDSRKQELLARLAAKLDELQDLHLWVMDVAEKPANEPARLVLSTEFTPSKRRLLELYSDPEGHSTNYLSQNSTMRLRIAIAELAAALGGFVVEANDASLPIIDLARENIRTLVMERVASLESKTPQAAFDIESEFELLARLTDSIVASRRSPRSNVAWNTIRTHAQPLADDIAFDLDRLAQSETQGMTQNVSKITSATDTLAMFSSLAFGFVVVLALLSARREALRISAPVVQLSQAAESVGRGEFSTKLPKSSTLEVKKLIESFQHMRNDISQSYGSLRSMAYTDDLTGLNNRKAFNEVLAEIAAQTEDDAASLAAIALIDLDHFKQVNDSMGHDAGDHILCVFAKRVQNAMRSGDLAARLGGDEFALILRQVADEEEARGVIDRLLKIISEPISYSGEILHTSATIGMVLVDNLKSDPDELLKRADIALYEAKEINRGTFRMYSKLTHQNVRRTRGLTDIVSTQHPSQVFTLHYQPVVDLETRELVGVEALLRWKNEDYEVDSILEVIALMERHGQMMRVSTWIVDAALEELCSWRDSGGHEISMGINVSADLLHDPNFVTMIQSALKKHQVVSEHLVLEVTETMVRGEFEISLAAMERLGALGIQFALDDFGTGYSSLIRLKEMPLGRLKIDRAFVADMLSSNDDSAIVEASIQLSHAIGMSVIAVGIESVEQADYLESRGCGYGQGYYFGRPAPAIKAVTRPEKQGSKVGKVS